MKDQFDKIAKYNFWKIKPNIGFFRDSYVNKLLAFEKSKLIKVLVGQRRAGKSYVLRQVISTLLKSKVPPIKTLYINKEFSEFDFIDSEVELKQFVDAYIDYHNIESKLFLFIDEVQLIKDWEKGVNGLAQDFTRDISIYITGSNSEMLSGELASLLSGRYVKIEVFPFSFEEYTTNLKLASNRISFIEYLQSGGLPELFNLDDDESKRFYLSSLRDTILLRDIVQRYNIKDTVLLMDIFIYLVNNVSVLFSINNVINYFKSKNRKTNYETVSSYINYLLNTYIIHKCERYDIKGKEVLSGNVKYYVNDLAFKNYLYKGFGVGQGYLLENSIYLLLIEAGFEVYVGAMRDSEIDFVAIKGTEKLYIQVAYTIDQQTTFEREVKAFSSIKDHYKKWIITLDDFNYNFDNGIIHIQAWDLESKLSEI
jgi:predicted AAA+ superfamily ATPase